MRNPSKEVLQEPTTVHEAKKKISRIRFGHGIYSDNDEEQLRKTDAEWAEMNRESAQTNRERIADVTKVFATQLYSSKFRFLYELIQNADDSSYQQCKNRSRAPSLEFKITPDTIVIETNEDGFTLADVKAICSVAQSSKKGNENTTGEKGLGFKSVFAIASHVHICSGLWSFEFRYPLEDDGLGMVTPYWKDSVKLNSNVGTRVTLTLARNDDSSLRDLDKAFEGITDTVLLFLRSIETLTISFEHGKKVGKRTFSRGSKWNDFAKEIRSTIWKKGEEERSETTLFKVWHETVMVARRSQRDGHNAANQEPTRVELAFPVDAKSSLPSITNKGQHVFAFLPIKRMPQLPFVIQASFDTTASREAVTDGPRNRELREAVAQLFANAIEVFCHREPSLQFRWTDFVPGEQLDDFWDPLRKTIRDSLAEKHLLVSQLNNDYKLISELRYVPSEFRSQDEPLFVSEDDLSDEYSSEAVETLQSLGLPTLSEEDFLDCIEYDLEAYTDSRIRSEDLDSVWHTSLTEILLESIIPSVDLRERLMDLEILPLSARKGANWVTPHSSDTEGEIFLPQICDDDSAPLMGYELGLRVIHEKASATPERRELYTHLGIGHAKTSTINRAVLKKNKSKVLNLKEYIRQFEILFWNCTELTSYETDLLYAMNGDRRVCCSPDLYLPSNEPYSTNKLLDGRIESSSSGFIHGDYLKCSMKQHANSDGQTWHSWLKEVAGIRWRPRLTDPGRKGLSIVFQEIIERNPSKVVGTLQEHWKEYKEQVRASSIIVEDLKNAVVECRTGDFAELRDTILPTKETIDASKRFGVEQSMLFLRTDDEAGPLDIQDWSFLKEFEVCCELSLVFHVDALDSLKYCSHSGDKVAKYANAIYSSIGSESQLQDRQKLQTFFTENDYIYARKNWMNVDDCVWDGPDFLVLKTVLAREYTGTALARDLFVNLLEMRDATYNDILAEIERIKQEDEQRPEHTEDADVDAVKMSKIYSELDELVDWNDSESDVRETFKKKALIFCDGKWFKLSSCIWNSAMALKKRAILKRVYPKLENFFVLHLGVKVMSASIMLRELVHISDGDNIDVAEVKDMLRQISHMLADEEPTDIVDELIKQLRQLKILPVSTPDSDDVVWLSSKDDFVISDDRRLHGIFQGDVKMLDFLPNEFSLMQPLFMSLRLENRYISHRVQSATSVEHPVLNESLTTDMRVRSYAISCCALSHKSTEFELYDEQKHQQLLKCEVYVSAGIQTQFSIKQGPDTIMGKSSIGILKICEEDEILKIYVPDDNARRQRCYRAYLPERLMSYLGVTLQHSEKQLYRILNDPLTSVDTVLFEEEIPEESRLERYEWEVEDEAEATAQSGDEEELIAQSYSRAQPQDRVEIHTLSSRRIQDNFDSITAEDAVPESAPPGLYRKVLEHVMRQARTIRYQGTDGGTNFDFTSMAEALNPHQSLPTRGDLGIMKNQPVTGEIFDKIGAAGELFVFESLRASGLRGIDHSHWRSRIRHLVTELPDYRTMEPYEFQEVSDLMFVDHDGKIEDLLRKNSFNAFPQWPNDPSGNHPISFYIEVKTTIKGCNGRFFLSQNQYKLLSDVALSANERPKIVYVIARVYHLLSREIGVKFFVDPKKLEGDSLEFEFRSCTVTPQT